MILINDVKYSCMECIRGHRSSTCKHTSRPLVQVRSRGRPSSNCNHRIAVLAEDVQNAPDVKSMQHSFSETKISLNEPVVKTESSCCSTPKSLSKSVSPPFSVPDSEEANTSSCCSSTVIKLKASKKKLVDVSRGSVEILGPYTDSSKVKKKVHHNCSCSKPKSFIMNSIRGSGRSCRDEKTKFSKWKFINFDGNRINMNNDPIKPHTASSSQSSEDVTLIPSCSTNGPCLCDDNCTCDGCLLHNSKGFDLSYLDFDMEDCSCLPEECACYDCEKHGIKGGIRISDGTRVSEAMMNDFSFPNSPIKSEAIHQQDPAIDRLSANMESALHANGLLNSHFQELANGAMGCADDMSCLCDESCTCDGCLKHKNITSPDSIQSFSQQLDQFGMANGMNGIATDPSISAIHGLDSVFMDHHRATNTDNQLSDDKNVPLKGESNGLAGIPTNIVELLDNGYNYNFNYYL